jgi:hypothetical protein
MPSTDDHDDGDAEEIREAADAAATASYQGIATQLAQDLSPVSLFFSRFTPYLLIAKDGHQPPCTPNKRLIDLRKSICLIG